VKKTIANLKLLGYIIDMTGNEAAKQDEDNKMKIDLIVSNGQYESAAEKITITATTFTGFFRRVDQIKKEHAVYGDNWAGWIDADVAVASNGDEWGSNQIIGGRWCHPANGWIVEDPSTSGEGRCCTYKEAWDMLQKEADHAQV